MRLFVAAELPDELLDALAETSAMLRSSVQGRYVAPASFHVTLAFLGEVDSARVPRLMDAIDESCLGYAPFDVTLGEFGSFGRRSKATLWQGLTDDGNLPELAKSVRDCLQFEGFDFDTKGFLPHVTLMRSADLTAGVLPAPVHASARIDTVTLFRSDLSGECPVYEALHRVRLVDYR